MPKTLSETVIVLGGFWHTTAMAVGYARLSTNDQKLEAQTDALPEAGAERISRSSAIFTIDNPVVAFR